MAGRIAIVEDHGLLGETLRIGLELRGIEAVVLAARPLDELCAAIIGQRPDLVLLDLDLGAFGDATAMIPALCDARLRVLVMTGVSDRVRIAAALEQGAIGYRSKSDGFEALVRAALAARDGTHALDPETRVVLLDELRVARRRRAAALAPFERLTDRERETLRAMAGGRTVEEIARGWVVSEATVRTHVRGVLRKLGVRSQLAAVAAGLQSGWLDGRQLAGGVGGGNPARAAKIEA